VGTVRHTHNRIEIDPSRCHGQPVVRDTRVPVKTLVGAVAAGDSIEQVAADYGVRVTDVQAAIEWKGRLDR
jgi:uncharacterized protein (DUF433 family)